MSKGSVSESVNTLCVPSLSGIRAQTTIKVKAQLVPRMWTQPEITVGVQCVAGIRTKPVVGEQGSVCGSVFSQGSALILCPGQGSEVKFGAVPNPCPALVSVSRHSHVCEGGNPQSLAVASHRKPHLFCLIFFFSLPLPSAQPGSRGRCN